MRNKADDIYSGGSKDNHDKNYVEMIACFHPEVFTRKFPDKKEKKLLEREVSLLP